MKLSSLLHRQAPISRMRLCVSAMVVLLVSFGGAIAFAQFPAGANPIPPPESFSFYASTVNQTTWFNLGESFGTDVVNGTFPQITLVVLEFGAPNNNGTSYGVCLAGSNPCGFVTLNAALAAVEQFGAGFYHNAGGTSAETFIAFGSTNYGTWFNGSTTNAHNFGVNQANEVNNGNTYFQGQGFGAKVEMRGAMDAEPAWGAYSNASAWSSGYGSTGSYKYWDNGSADGCPTSGAGGCLNSWTQTDEYDLAWHTTLAEPLPQIYNTSMAEQWGTIVNVVGLITFLGPTSQHQACTDKSLTCSGTDFTPNQSWNGLYDYLNCGGCSDPQTPPHVTNMRWTLAE